MPLQTPVDTAEDHWALRQGMRAELTGDGCKGAQDLLVEIVSPPNPGMGYVSKLTLLRVAGVREYRILDPRRRLVPCYDFAQVIADPSVPDHPIF